MASISGIGAIDGTRSITPSRTLPRPEPAADTAARHRAIVPVAPPTVAESSGPNPVRPGTPATAAFLTHLIATERGVPQTRARRRADPNWAIATYAAAMRAPEAPTPTVSAMR